MAMNWYHKHMEGLTIGDRVADIVTGFIGSWRGIIISNFLVAIWILINLDAYYHHWDPYPFILLNLVFSWQAYNAAPLIMMHDRRQSDRDRIQAQHDYEVNEEAKHEIETLQKELARLELEKLDVIIKKLNKKKK